MSTCNQILTYRKANPSEIINVGDVLMLDPNTNYITRAYATGVCDNIINSKLIIGVCIQSNNYSNVDKIINGGHSIGIPYIERLTIDGGTSSNDRPSVIILDGGRGEQNQREIIQLVYTGKQLVNICGYVNLGDTLSIGRVPGKAESTDYLTNNFYVRPIGKVIQYTSNPNQVKVLLDIE